VPDTNSNEFFLSVLTPDKCFYNKQAREIVFETSDGRIGVMAGHMPMVAAVLEGTLDINAGGEWKTAAVSQGFAEITGEKVEFFVDTVEWADDIDAARAREALERAKMRMQSELSLVEYIHTRAAMARALARLKASGK